MIGPPAEFGVALRRNGPAVKDTMISHFRVLRLIGSGGMSEVYLAEDGRLRRKVAIKLLPPEVAPDEEQVLRFQQEARAASALNHPNIVTLYDIGEESDRRYIATEFIDGETLREKIEKGAMPLRDVLDIAIGIASALKAAHQVGVIHRDIKPENVMIRPDGLVKVLDFGLAKLTEPDRLPLREGGGARLTEPGLVIGTIQYMSPEQLRGAHVDHRTDLFSLGEVIYEMVTGASPFDSPSTSEVIASILEREPGPIARRGDPVSVGLREIVERALRKDPADRYQSAGEILTDLTDLRQDLEFADHQRRSGPREAGPAPVHGPSQPVNGTAADSSYLVREIRANPDLLLVMAVLLALLIGSLSYFSGDAEGYDSIAVLPFDNRGGSGDTEHLSDGLTESIIHSLSRVSTLSVTAPSSVFRYKAADVDPLVAGRQLGVEAVLTGSVQRQGEMLVIRADLVDVSKGTILWGQQYYRRVSDLVLIQREMSEDISSKLRLRLSGAERAMLTRATPVSPAAFEEYLRGRYWWNQRTDAGLRRAIRHFEKSIQEDPTYALPYAGLADAYNLMPVYGVASPADSFPRAKAAALRALELDDQLAEAHTSLAWAKMNYDWSWGEAEASFRRAIEINPSYATAHHWYSLFLSAMGRSSEALDEASRARDLDPLSLAIQVNVGTIYYQAGSTTSAIEQFRKCLAVEPDFRRGKFELARALEVNGEVEAATLLFEELARDGEAEENAALARVHALSGNTEAARSLLNELIGEQRWGYVNPYTVAAVWVGLGDRDEAFRWLDIAHEQHVSRLIYLNVEPMFRGLRSDPRFHSLRQRLNLPAGAEREGRMAHAGNP